MSIRQQVSWDVMLDQIIGTRAVTPRFQPIVELDTGAVVGFEALSRGPEGTDVENPDELFSMARRSGRVAELDALCRQRALEGASSNGLEAPLSLFVNTEPEALDAGEHGGQWAEVPGLRCFAEVTERALLARPAGLLRTLRQVRELGWGVALDDVGAHPDSLALMPLINPDVIKLDLGLLRVRPSPDLAKIIHAVSAQAERSGAAVVAEGIETEGQRRKAVGMGARYGQGYLFGPPAPLPHPLPTTAAQPPELVAAPDLEALPTPFRLMVEACGVRVGPKDLLVAIARQLEDQALTLGLPPVVLTSFERAEQFTGLTCERYRHLAERLAFVGVLGPGISHAPAPGVRGGPLQSKDPIVGEWSIAVVGAHFAAAFVALDAAGAPDDGDRPFHYGLTFERDLVLRVARSLLRRISPLAA